MKKHKKTYTATEARKDFYNILRRAAKPGEQITITLTGEEPVILMSHDDFEGWMETLEVMSDPQLVRDIEIAKKEKDGVDWQEFRKEFGV